MITGVQHQYELDLIKFLEANHQKYWIRQVVVPGFTDSPQDLKLLGQFIRKLKYMTRFELLPYHKLAINKYQELSIPYKLNKVKAPTKEQIAKAKRLIEQA
jgi:pyruvate formate lyase activating enzyme